MGVPLNRKCTVPGCTRAHYGRGFCSMHYQRVKIHGIAGAGGLTRAEGGAGWTSKQGYRFMAKTREHIAIVEEVIGHPLPPGAEVHHVNGRKSDNDHSNLVVCPDREYHALLHVRARALDECSNANWRKCPFCKRYDDPAAMQSRGHSKYRHAACHAAYEQQRTQGERDVYR